MTPFDETTWTTNESVLPPTHTTARDTHTAPTDTRPQGPFGIASLTLGITSWMIVLLLFTDVRNRYGGWEILVSTAGAIILGAIGMAPTLTTRRGMRRGAAIAGLVLGLAVVAGLVVIVGLFFLLLASGGVQLG